MSVNFHSSDSSDDSLWKVAVDSNGNLISADANTDSSKIYIHSGISSTITSSSDSSDIYDIDLKGIVIDPDTGNLISVDNNKDPSKIYIHDGTSSTIITSFDISDIYSFNIDSKGINNLTFLVMSLLK